MDSDLAESIRALKDGLERIQARASFVAAPAETIEAIRSLFRLPRRYRDFLAHADPRDCETRTPSERVRLIPAAQLLAEQESFSLENQQVIPAARPNGWRPSWFVIAHSTLLGDPYFLDLSSVDAEGDCQVFSAMSGTEQWQPQLCASSFASFLRILGVSMEVAAGFHESDLDYDDEFTFREALRARIREQDRAASKAGHWT